MDLESDIKNSANPDMLYLESIATVNTQVTSKNYTNLRQKDLELCYNHQISGQTTKATGPWIKQAERCVSYVCGKMTSRAAYT